MCLSQVIFFFCATSPEQQFSIDVKFHDCFHTNGNVFLVSEDEGECITCTCVGRQGYDLKGERFAVTFFSLIRTVESREESKAAVRGSDLHDIIWDRVKHRPFQQGL